MSPQQVASDPQARRQALEALLGKVTLQTSDWMREGVIVRVRVSCWRPRARLEIDDLGLPQFTPHERTRLRTLLRLGSKRLLPDARYRNLERCVRSIYRVLETLAYTTRWGQFVPLTAYPAWAEAHAVAVADLLAVRDDLITNRAAIVDDLRAQYTLVAQRAWRVLALQETPAMFEEVFVSTFCDRIVACVPPSAVIRDSFAVDVAYNLILPPEGTAELPATSETGAPPRLPRPSPLYDVLRSMQQQRTDLIDSFLADIAIQLRTLVYTAADDVLAAIAEPGNWQRGGLHPRSLGRLRTLVTQVEHLNFFHDQDVTAMMAQIRSYLDQPAPERTTDTIATLLRDIYEHTRVSLHDLGVDVIRTARTTEEQDGDTLPTTAADEQRAERAQEPDAVVLPWDDTRAEREL